MKVWKRLWKEWKGFPGSSPWDHYSKHRDCLISVQVSYDVVFDLYFEKDSPSIKWFPFQENRGWFSLICIKK